LLVGEALAAQSDTVRLQQRRDGALGEVMFGHELIGRDAGVVFGDDLVDLISANSTLQSSGSAGFRVLGRARFGLLEVFVQVSVSF